MNNINSTETRHIRLAFFFITFLLCACWLYSINERLLLDPDTFWHIAVGKGIWETGRFPISDDKSHTFYGSPWIAKEWLSQVIFYLAYRTGGWPLLVSCAVLSLSFSGSLLYLFLSSRINNGLALVMMLASVILSMQAYLVRPHVFTFPLCVLWTEHLLRASEQNRAPPFWLLAVLVAWANLHNSFTVGFAIAALCAANFFERAGFSHFAALRRWALFLPLCLMASMLHPYGYEPLLVSLNAPGNEWVTLKGEWHTVGEWRAVDVGSEPVHALVLGLLLCFLLRFGLKLNWSKTALVTVMLYAFLSHIRFVYLFYFLVPLAISFELQVQYPRVSTSNWAANLNDKVSVLLSRRAPIIVGFAISLYLAVAASFTAFTDLKPRDAIAPAKALEAIRASGLTGNVLNSDEFGGFLVFAGIKTFLDGRNDQLFRGQFLRDVLKSQKTDGDEILSRQLRQYNIGWTLLRPSDPRVQKLDADPCWKRLYEDPVAVVHVPATPAY